MARLGIIHGAGLHGVFATLCIGSACTHPTPAAAGSSGAEATTSAGSEDSEDATTGPSGPALPPRGDTQPCRFEGHAPGTPPPLTLSDAIAVPAPVDLVAADGDDRVYVALAHGEILGGTPQRDGLQPVVDLSAQGRLVALAVPPDHASTGHLFVRYEASIGAPRTVISRITVEPTTGTAEPDLERVVMEIDDAIGERSGGALVFGNDGMLFIGVGDLALGEISGEPQDHGSRLGKLLRVDVAQLDISGTFTIPSDNPFIGDGDHADEVWATGLRDPWRCVPVPAAPELWCVDRGALEQEIDRVRVRDNLGWPYADGRTCLLPSGDCSDLTAVAPVTSYRTSADDCGIAGVVAARDPEQPDLDGTLLYADRCSGRLRGLALDSDGVSQSEVLGLATAGVTAIGQDGAGRSFALTSDDTVARVAVVAETGSFPLALSDSGCFTDLATLEPAPDVIPYELNAQLWTDGAIKRRFLALPPGTTIGFDDAGAFELPRGTIILKVFSFEMKAGEPDSRRAVETRVMVRGEHGWQFHSYRWNAEGSDAELLSSGARADIVIDDHGEPLRFAYDWPARGTCKVCHGLDPAAPLGPRIDQLNGELDYGPAIANQLEALDAIGMFADGLPDVVDALPRIVAPNDEDATDEQRARAWLHGNCGHCHRPGGWAPPALTLDLRYSTASADTHTCGVELQYYNAWVDSEIRIVAGDPEGSALWERLQRRGDGQMPPLGTSLVDPGSDVVGAWIAGLSECP